MPLEGHSAVNLHVRNSLCLHLFALFFLSVYCNVMIARAYEIDM